MSLFFNTNAKIEYHYNSHEKKKSRLLIFIYNKILKYCQNTVNFQMYKYKKNLKIDKF